MLLHILKRKENSIAYYTELTSDYADDVCYFYKITDE